MIRACRIYKVHDENGKVEFRGSVHQIADHYFLSYNDVYSVAKGKYKKFLNKYTLEYVGKEIV